MMLAVMLLDDTNNHEYFCHKYKISNLLKEHLDILASNLKESRIDKNFFKNNLKKNIYFSGKKDIKNLAILIFFVNKNFSYEDLTKLIKNIEKIKIPRFPFNGKFLIDKGFSEGRRIGSILKKLEKNWVENDYRLSEKDISTIIEKEKN